MHYGTRGKKDLMEAELRSPEESGTQTFPGAPGQPWAGGKVSRRHPHTPWA